MKKGPLRKGDAPEGRSLRLQLF